MQDGNGLGGRKTIATDAAPKFAVEAFRTKTDSVFESLKAAIINGDLKPGDWIRNSDWADRLHVSPIPVREALGRLEAQGLVEIGAHKGARVTSQTDAHVEETYLIRIALESLAARLALEQISDEAFARLVSEVEDLSELLEEHIRARNLPAALSTNFDIHMTIYKAAGRPRLVSMIENLWATYPFGSSSWPDGRWDAMQLDHRRYLKVLKERDPEKMGLETERHIRHARDLRVGANPYDAHPSVSAAGPSP
jgi:DNA-binding GntR family transcriptional regulator